MRTIQTASILAVTAVILAVIVFAIRKNNATSRRRKAAIMELAELLSSGRGYRTAVRVSAKHDWVGATGIAGGQLVLENGEEMDAANVQQFVVAYPSGEVLTFYPPDSDLPNGFHFIHCDQPAEDTLDQGTLDQSATDVRIEFGEPYNSSNRGRVYSTKLINKTGSAIRIVRFGAYTRVGNLWKLRTISRGFFTAQQFVEWYGTPADGWIPNGSSSEDPSNYGPGALWYYEYETRENERHFATGIAPH